MSNDLLQGFERLSPAKQKLLLARLRRQEEARAETPAGAPTQDIPPSPLRATGGPYPLSFAQQRLWFVDRLEPGNPAFNLADAVRVSGRLDAGVMARALSEVVRRHEALRTALHGPATADVSPEDVTVVEPLPAAPPAGVSPLTVPPRLLPALPGREGQPGEQATVAAGFVAREQELARRRTPR